MRPMVSISILASMFLLIPTALLAQVDSRLDWFDEDASQGENGWFYGYYNWTEDRDEGDGVYQAEDFILFDEEEHWGDRLDMADTPVWRLRESLAPEHAPFTFIGQEDTHPNGVHEAILSPPRDGHWTIRRYVYNGETQLVRIEWHTHKQDIRCGDGVCGHLFVNDDEVDKVCIDSNDDVGFTHELFIKLSPGDTVDLALSPSGNPFLTDGCDRSANWMTITFPLPDTDDDGKTDDRDNCPDDSNEDQADGDEDGLGDVCDNCPAATNADQADRDSNDIGDVCDDGDEDGELDVSDNCPDTSNADQADGDNDGVGTLCDNCPELANTDQSDVDGDGTGDVCDDELADSRAGWSRDGVQGENNWFYGYYNLTQDQADDDGVYQAGDVIEFDKEDHWGDRPDLLMLNPGPAWRLSPAGAPFTFLGRRDTHPNGTNAFGEEHWTVRRYLYDGRRAEIQIKWFLRIGDQPCGGQPGVSGHVFVNDDEVDTVSIPGDDRVGVERQLSVELRPGDTVDLVLTPVGPDGDRFDSCDGSVNWMTLVCEEVTCEPQVGTPFRRADCDQSGTVDFNDAIFHLKFLFLGENEDTVNSCKDACDSDDSGADDFTDDINTLKVLFLGQGSIPEPGPLPDESHPCGVDPTIEEPEELTCDTYETAIACP